MIPGETDAARKTIFFPIFTSDGLLASGGADPNDEGALATAAGATLQYQHNRDAPAAALGTFGHNARGEFYYIFDNAEVASILTEGTVAFIYVKAGFRSQVMRVPFEYPQVDLRKWRGSVPAVLTASGFVQSLVQRWLTDNAAGTPVALSTSGFLQALLMRWITDDPAGTPRVLDNQRVDASIGDVQTLAASRVQSAVALITAQALAATANTVSFQFEGQMGDMAAVALANNTFIGMTLTLHNTAFSLVDTAYPQTRRIIGWSFVGTIGTATLDEAWDPMPAGVFGAEGDYTVKLWPGPKAVLSSADLAAAVTTINNNTDADTALVIAAIPTAAQIRDAILDAARAGHVIVGSVGEAIALSTSLLQGNFFIDNVTNTANGPTAQRLRCWTSAAGMAGATPGGVGQGEFATFIVTTTYSGPNKITTHRVVQQ